MDASVSVETAESAELDENHASGRSLGSLLLFTEAGVSADVALGPSQASRLARKDNWSENGPGRDAWISRKPVFTVPSGRSS
jgi:hypothetical protein